jgi:hypothetical protein
MKFERANPDCSFNVKQQLEFYSTIGALSGPDTWVNMWQAAKLFIQDWACPLLPDMETDLETVDDPEIAGVLIWASARVNTHINGLKSLPKV